MKRRTVATSSRRTSGSVTTLLLAMCSRYPGVNCDHEGPRYRTSRMMDHRTMMGFRRDRRAQDEAGRPGRAAARARVLPPVPRVPDRVRRDGGGLGDHRGDPAAALPQPPRQRRARQEPHARRRARTGRGGPRVRQRRCSRSCSVSSPPGSAKVSSTTSASRCSTTCSTCRSPSSPAPRPVRCSRDSTAT